MTCPPPTFPRPTLEHITPQSSPDKLSHVIQLLLQRRLPGLRNQGSADLSPLRVLPDTVHHHLAVSALAHLSKGTAVAGSQQKSKQEAKLF